MFQIKFFTKYGLCRVTNFTMPMLPVHVSKFKRIILDEPIYQFISALVSFQRHLIILFIDSVGAVALPDGRVLICGGEILERKFDEVIATHNNIY